MSSAADIIGLDAIIALRAAGFVVVHQEPTDSMLNVGGDALGYCDGSLKKAWHRMVGVSINAQNSSRLNGTSGAATNPTLK